MSVLWTPAEITTALWLDADDSGTITLSGSDVTQWDDKSGNNRHATQSSAGSRPSFEASGIGGKGTIRFSDSTKQFFNLSYPDVGSDNRTLLIVAEHFSDDQDLQNPLIDLGDFDQADGAFALTTEPAIRVIGGNRIWGSGLSFSTPYLIAVTLDGSTTDDLALHLNGNLETPTSTATNAINTRGQARIASLFSRLLDGRISEVVVLASAAVDADRQKIEGYLAHKWGLEDNLDSDHPYKSEAPTIPTVENLQATSLGTDSIQVTWDQFTNDESPPVAADGYEIEIDSGTPIDVGDVQTYTDDELSAETTRSYRVRAYYSGSPTEYTEWSEAVQATTDSEELTTIPRSFIITADIKLRDEAPEVSEPPDASGLQEVYAQAGAILSLRKVVDTYSGSAIRVRRSSDDAEQDIGFSDGLLDSDTLLSFVGANDGRVVTWYDQSGNGRDHPQPDADSRQPYIVTSGSLETANSLPAIRFGTTSIRLREVSSSLFQNISHKAIYCVGQNNDADSGAVEIYYCTTDSLTDVRLSLGVNSTGGTVKLAARRLDGAVSENEQSNTGPGTNQFQISGLISYTDTLAQLYLDGTLVAEDDEFQSSGSTSNTASSSSNIGANSNGNNPFPGVLQELILFNTDLSAFRQVIEKDQDRYWK